MTTPSRPQAELTKAAESAADAIDQALEDLPRGMPYAGMHEIRYSLREAANALRAAALSPPSPSEQQGLPIDIGEYQRRVIALFKSGQATEVQWAEMSRCVLWGAEQDLTYDQYPEQIDAAVQAAQPKAPSQGEETCRSMSLNLQGFEHNGCCAECGKASKVINVVGVNGLSLDKPQPTCKECRDAFLRKRNDEQPAPSPTPLEGELLPSVVELRCAPWDEWKDDPAAAPSPTPGEAEEAWKRLEEDCRDEQDRCSVCGGDDGHKLDCDLLTLKAAVELAAISRGAGYTKALPDTEQVWNIWWVESAGRWCKPRLVPRESQLVVAESGEAEIIHMMYAPCVAPSLPAPPSPLEES